MAVQLNFSVVTASGKRPIKVYVKQLKKDLLAS